MPNSWNTLEMRIKNQVQVTNALEVWQKNNNLEPMWNNSFMNVLHECPFTLLLERFRKLVFFFFFFLKCVLPINEIQFWIWSVTWILTQGKEWFHLADGGRILGLPKMYAQLEITLHLIITVLCFYLLPTREPHLYLYLYKYFKNP